MNKYKKALDRLKELTVSEEHNKLYSVLQELVDKETPLKPIETKWEYACGKCMNAIHVKNEMHCEAYCDNCGQKIDWSNDDEH